MPITLETFGERVSWLMKRPEVDMSQKELAAAMGVSEQFMSALIRGKSKPNVSHVRQLARLLHTSVDFLTLATDDPAPREVEEPDHGVGISEEAQEIASIVDNLPPWRRRELLAAARLMVEANEALYAELHTLTPELQAQLDAAKLFLDDATLAAIDAAISIALTGRAPSANSTPVRQGGGALGGGGSSSRGGDRGGTPSGRQRERVSESVRPRNSAG